MGIKRAGKERSWEVTILSSVVRTRLTEKVRFEVRPEGDEGGAK